MVSLATMVCPSSLTHSGAQASGDVTGKWQGKFSNDEGASAATDPVAVEILVKREGDKLSGTVTFYVIRNEGGRPQVKGKSESELIDPRFDGTTLTFSVTMKGPYAAAETKTAMQMKLTSDHEAELENTGDISSLLFKMKKVQ
jgi:hypothetical protein